MNWEKELIETATNRDLAEIVRKALLKLLKEDVDLLKIDGSERSISHRLAVHMESLFAGWNVDCEYNRKGHDKAKTLGLEGDPNGPEDEGSRVFPDIIVHHRTVQKNHLVVEIKKSTSRQSDERDIAKLRAFLTELDYQHGLFLRIGCGMDTGAIEVWWAKA